jgi:hypothetical protein
MKIVYTRTGSADLDWCWDGNSQGDRICMLS